MATKKFITLDNLGDYSTKLAAKISAAHTELKKTATTSADGMLSKEDKAKLDTLVAASESAVLSVNGKTGAVVIAPEDIGDYGVAELDSTGKVPSSRLPSYVDDVLEYDAKANFPTTGETGKIYVAKDTNLTYRWGGTAYVEISPSIALGDTSSTAYAGDKGKANAEAIAAEVTRAKAAEQTNATAISTETARAKAAEEANATAISDEATRAKAAEAANASAISALQTSNSGKQDKLKAGKNITIATDGVTISATDTTYDAASESAAGLMSADDKKKLNAIAEGATKITVDSALSSTSTNPVQNKVINDALGKKQNTLTFDSTPTSGSTNPVTSGGVYDAVSAKQDALSSEDATFSDGVMTINAATTAEVQALVDAMSF